MKVMICIPIDVNVDTTKRKEIRAATRRWLIEQARAEKPAEIFRAIADKDEFLVRAPEAPAKSESDTIS